MTHYLVTLPERLLRSVVGLGAGLAREVGDLVLPDSVRQGQLYRNMVDTTLRFLIEQVGGAEGAYPVDGKLPDGRQPRGRLWREQHLAGERRHDVRHGP